jgi:hypothetical protein
MYSQKSSYAPLGFSGLSPLCRLITYKNIHKNNSFSGNVKVTKTLEKKSVGRFVLLAADSEKIFRDFVFSEEGLIRECLQVTVLSKNIVLWIGNCSIIYARIK